MVIQNYSFVRIPAYVKKLLDEVLDLNRLDSVLSFVIPLGSFIVLMMISLFLMRKLIIGVSRKIEFHLREDLYNKLLSLDYLFFQKNETGDLVSRCTNDLNDVRTLLGPGVMYIPNALSRMCLFIPVLIGLSGRMMLIIGGMMVFLVMLIVVLLPRLRPLFLQIQQYRGRINDRVWQTISGINTIKLNTIEENEIGRFKDLNRGYIRKNMSLVRFRESLWPLFIFVFSLTELVILWVGGNRVIAGSMSIGELLQFNMMIVYLTFPVLSLGWVISLMQQGIGAMSRINYILNQPVNRCRSHHKPAGNGLSFIVKNLNYRYPGSGKPVLRDISLTIDPGEKIGITGMIGSGKSTLLMILTGLLPPEPGQVSINGVDICRLDPHFLSENISVVSQNPYLFSKTIEENILMGGEPETSKDRIMKVIEEAGLAADINTFPDGIDQMVGERGVTLSGGQRQRLALSRALNKSASMLVLDDPFSSVDSETEEKILRYLVRGDRFQTLIVVSHRLSIFRQLDRILVMNNGTVVEQGSHISLMKKRGLYRRLVDMQNLGQELGANGTGKK